MLFRFTYYLFAFLLITGASANAKQANTALNYTTIKILGINDFHGQISTGRTYNNRPVGGAAILASYLKYAQIGLEEHTLITIMGDQVGASPSSSGLLHDEPSILFTNSLGNAYCSTQNRMNPLCNIIATVGNHEFDKGQKALFELFYGTNNRPTKDWISLPYYPGTAYPYISANIVEAETNKPVFPPYVIKWVDGIPIAFIGALFKNASGSMFPSNSAGLKFLDEAATINQYIPEIKAQGVQIIIVLIHEGGQQIPYEGPTQKNTQVTGKIKDIIQNLDDGIDVVMAGHTHQFLNAFLPNKNGHEVLVTQANSYSQSFTEVTLEIERSSQKVNKKLAQIITTYADRFPGTIPDKATQQLIQLAEEAVAPIVSEYAGTTQNALLRERNEDGESNLGNLITDAFRKEMNTQLSVINPYGIRNDIPPGAITYGTLYSVLPFANQLVSMTLKGEAIYELLEQQWMGSYPDVLHISGFTYQYNPQHPVGHKIISVSYEGRPLEKETIYTLATSDYLVFGSGIFSALKKGKIITISNATDCELALNYVRRLLQPFTIEIEGRIKKVST